MSNIMLMMAGLTADGIPMFWVPDESAPSGVVGIDEVLAPGAGGVLMVEVGGSQRARREAEDEVARMVGQNKLLLARCRQGPVDGLAPVCGFGVRMNPTPVKHLREYHAKQQSLGVAGIRPGTCHIAFSEDVAGWAADRRTHQESRPLEEMLSQWELGCPPISATLDPDDLLRFLVVGFDVRTLVISSSFA